jgi:hypothetical protein
VACAPLAAGSIAGALTFVDDSGGITNAIQQVQLQGNALKAATVTTITSVSPSPVLVGRPVTGSYSVYRHRCHDFASAEFHRRSSEHG